MNNEKDLTKLVDQIKQASNILVAVSANPTVDELASALGLTLMLNKNNRRALAIFSGEVPNVLKFLKPTDTFDTNADGLRDFIITLDSKKADRVVLKAEDDLVKVFVTPSGSTVSRNDLGFSQGDYNVDLVVALGVVQRDGFDKALAAHGRILHNAAVTSLMIGEQASDLGNLNIRAPKASSYAEIIAQLPELLDAKLDEKDEPSMDESVATALLTSLVAVTNRFSNTKTTAELMSLASDLMKEGANQQLVASELAKGSTQAVEADAKSSQPDITNDEVSVRPDKVSDNQSNVINLKTKTKKTETEVAELKSTVETPVEKPVEIKIEPGFANLEEYNKQQLDIERQKVADDLMAKMEDEAARPEIIVSEAAVNPVAPEAALEVPTVAKEKELVIEPLPVGEVAPAPVSEDDKLAKELEQVAQTENTDIVTELKNPSIEVQPIAKPDSTIVFGKEVDGAERSYLQDDPSMAWGQAINPALIEAAPAVTPPAAPLAPEVPAPSEPSMAPIQPEPSTPVQAPSSSAIGDLPPLPDFSSLNIAPPVPPIPPNFALPMPPLPPNPSDFAQPAVTPGQLNQQAERIIQHTTFAPSAMPAPVENQPALPVDQIGQGGPIMAEQVYPPMIDNAQFVIPE